jgi:hypothetical protein
MLKLINFKKMGGNHMDEIHRRMSEEFEKRRQLAAILEGRLARRA